MKKIAIIGAGLAGLTLARKLLPIAEVTVFEKARGVGGRMSTRYAEPFYFDHGAQFFTARTAQFKDFIQPFLSAGDIQEWQGKLITFETGKKTTKRLWFEPHYVGAPNMNSFCKKLGSGLSVKLNVEVAPLVRLAENGNCKIKPVQGWVSLIWLYQLRRRCRR